MTETVETILGKTLDTRYRLLDKLGAGGQGEVWRAHDTTRGVDVALKVLTPKAREHEAWSALEHEYSIASLLDHPSILKVYPPERSGDAMILPMELAPGGDLRSRRGAGFLEIIPVLLEISQALEHAHERGVVHRDLKPGNILFDARGRAKLADFGVAETAMTDQGTPSTASSTVPTRDTNKHGYSPFTASPAQLRGEPPTPADDVYGLGALAYELLSGYPPYYPHFDKKRAMEERVPTLVPTRQIPPLLGTLVMHMLAKDPKRRPRTMRAVIDSLDASLNDTLTYDFENVSPATPTGSAAVVAAAEAAAAKSAAARSRETDSSSSGSQPRPFVWTPDSGDRRSSADRRGRRKEDFPPASSSSDAAGRRSSDGSAEDGSRSSRRPGADALARIDAALERSAGDTGSHRRPSQDATKTGDGRPRPWESTSSTGSHRSLSHGASGSAAADTGSHRAPTQDASGSAAADTGSHRAPTSGASGSIATDTGSHRTPSPRAPGSTGDTSSHRASTHGASGSFATDTGSHRVPPQGASTSSANTGSHRALSPGASGSTAADTGSHRAPTSGASGSAATDTGSHRVPPQGASGSAADTGSHRAPSNGASASTGDTGSLPRPSADVPTASNASASHSTPTSYAPAASASDTGSRPKPATPTYEPTVKIRSPFLQPNDGLRSRSSHFLSETSGSLGRPKSAPVQSATPASINSVFRSKGSQSAPMTPAEAAAIVAAARAAAKAEAAAPKSDSARPKGDSAARKADVDTSQTMALPPINWDTSQTVAVPPLKWDTSQTMALPPLNFDTSQTVALPPLKLDTSKTVALPPLSPDYVPPEFRGQQPERPKQTAARSAALARKSEPAALPTPANTSDLSKTMMLPPLSPDYVPPEFREEQRASLTAARAALWDRKVGSGDSPTPPRAVDTSKTVALPPLPPDYVPTEFLDESARAASDTQASSRELTPPPLAPTNPMWPIEGKAAARASNSTTSSAQSAAPKLDVPARSTDTVAIKQPPKKTEPIILESQPTFRRDNLTVGTYPDPTSILTRDTVVQTAPMSVNWGDVRLDELPKVSRLEPIPPRRWPWVVLGLAAGAAAALYFWLPRFDTQELPPEVAAVVEPLKSAIVANSLSSDSSASNSPVNAAQGAGQVETSAPDNAAGAVGSAAAGRMAPTGGAATGGTTAGGSAAAVRGAATAGGTTAGGSATPTSSTTAGGPTQPSATTARTAGSAAAATPAAGVIAHAAVISSATPTSSAGTAAANGSSGQPFTPAEEQRLRDMRQLFDDRLKALDARGAGVWGGREYSLARMRAAESVGAHDAGNPRLSQDRLAAASKFLDIVENRAPQALTTQVSAGEQALKEGQQEVAGQAFDLARRINPNDRRAVDGQRRAQNLPAVLPLLADAQNAEADHDYARAAQDYSQALALDPNNAAAKAGQARANAAFGDDSYAKYVGAGFAALGAGRLDEAREVFVKARALNPRGAEAYEGLKRVGAALTARGFASMRQRAASLENQERWEEAQQTYEDVLAADSSLAFAQEGKARTTSRADLSLRLQQIIDRPDRLSSPGVKDDARALLQTARAQSPQGPVIRSQIARLETLLTAGLRPTRPVVAGVR